jgi:pimeloyl-ACP methyl ester carboxylesterase
MVTVLLVHGVGGASDKARWLEPLNRRLAEFGFSALAAPADDILVPDYSGLFDVKEFREPAVTYSRPDDRRLSRQKIDYAVRQKTLERQIRPVAESSDVFGFNHIPDALGDTLADAAEFLAFESVTKFVERSSVRHAIWSHLLKELPSHGSIIIVAHSLGSVAVAGLLRRLPPGLRVELLITIGSPLYFERYRSTASSLVSDFPYQQVQRWLNVYSPWDGVTGGGGIARKVPQALDACAHINGDHDLEAYMSHPAVAMAVGSVLFGDGLPMHDEAPGAVSRRLHDSWLELLLGSAFSIQISRDMHSDKWRDRMRLDAAREEVARRAVADIETQTQRRADLLVTAMKAGMQISQSQADDHPCADGRFPTYRDLTFDASDHLRGKWADEELLSLSVALMMQPIVAPFDIRADMDQRCKALELTLDRVRRPGGNLADRTFAEQVTESLRWAQKSMSDGKFPWGAVLIGSGLVVLAATGVGLGQVRANRSGATAHADVAPEHVRLRDVGYVGDTDPTDHATGTGGLQRLDDGLVGADALQDGVGTDAVRELLDSLDAVVASLRGVHQMQSKAVTREPICAR